MTDTAIALFTRDLRVRDNPMLSAAAEHETVLPVFIRDSAVAASRFSGSARQLFLDACLVDLDHNLRQIGSGLLIRHGGTVQEVCAIVHETNARSVHIAADVSTFSRTRERQLRAALSELRCDLQVHQNVHTVQIPGDITPASSDHYSVFSPYHRAWAQTARRDIVPSPGRLRLPAGVDVDIPVQETASLAEWPAGETGARERARTWLADDLRHYADQHDALADDCTSRLSPYLHLGCLSALELATLADERPSEGSAAFVRQLCWRDFHAQVLHARPEVAWQDYRPRGDHWRDEQDAWDAWREGLTGYPIVDAGMRQLRAEGWMHNRARLIVASFLTKTLYLDWRKGATHFLAELVDGDLANNNLNWQWVAGTGTDSRPNRVLNPIRQAHRYDPDGAYVRRWVPELSGVDDVSAIHEPWRTSDAAIKNYPSPIVDLREGRDRFLAART